MENIIITGPVNVQLAGHKENAAIGIEVDHVNKVKTAHAEFFKASMVLKVDEKGTHFASFPITTDLAEIFLNGNALDQYKFTLVPVTKKDATGAVVEDVDSTSSKRGNITHQCRILDYEIVSQKPTNPKAYTVVCVEDAKVSNAGEEPVGTTAAPDMNGVR